jgi:pyruvate dehydrogenase E2 component (dihydrolipoamide acetyltransferase)
MAEVILMPRLSDTMTEGVVAAWHKNVGDTVKKGDLLAEIETDKATMELESYQDGVLLHIGTPRGGKLQVNDLLAIFGKAGEDVSALIAQNTGATNTPAPAQTMEMSAAPAASSTPAAPTVPTADFSAMEEVVLMPRLSDTMTEGVIAGWHKQIGDSVKKGAVLAATELNALKKQQTPTIDVDAVVEAKLQQREVDTKFNTVVGQLPDDLQDKFKTQFEELA